MDQPATRILSLDQGIFRRANRKARRSNTNEAPNRGDPARQDSRPRSLPAGASSLCVPALRGTPAPTLGDPGSRWQQRQGTFRTSERSAVRIDHGGSAASGDAALKSPSTRSLRLDPRLPSRRWPPAPPGLLPPEPVPLTLLTSAPPHQPAAPPRRPGLPRWSRALLESARSMNIPRASLEPTGLRQNRQVLVIFSFALPYLPPQVLAGGLLGGSRTFCAETCLIFPINFHLRTSPLNWWGGQHSAMLRR